MTGRSQSIKADLFYLYRVVWKIGENLTNSRTKWRIAFTMLASVSFARWLKCRHAIVVSRPV